MIFVSKKPNLILLPNVSLRSFLFLNFLCLWLCVCSSYIASVASMEKENHLTRKRGLAEVSCSENQTYMLGVGGVQQSKKLRRLPHVFSRVLELPVRSDADVLVEVSSGYFRFVVGVDESASVCGQGARVVVRAVQVYPGVVKVVVRGHGSDDEDDELRMDGLELDRWRFRLPVTTSPEQATAVCVDGELVVTVPKNLSVVDGDGDETWSGIERFVEVL